jgi:hypothetical protein
LNSELGEEEEAKRGRRRRKRDIASSSCVRVSLVSATVEV